MANTKNHRPMKVLIVEDEPTLLDIYSTEVRMKGYEVIEAKDGIEGLEAAINAMPSIILLDIILPMKDGFEVLKDLKSNQKTKGIPVIILSNLGQEFEVKRGLALGAVRFLIKANLTPDRLVEEIRANLSSGERA